jgi:uncharacterized protein YndB with AHSA1/START domain
MSEIRTVRVENAIRFRATPERVFAAMTTETLQWFPHTYGEERVVAVVTDAHAGGVVKEDWGNGYGHVYSIIQEWDPPHTLTTRGWLDLGVTLDTTTTVEADGDETVLTVSKVAVGPLTEDQAAGIHKYGGLDNFEPALRAWVER